MKAYFKILIGAVITGGLLAFFFYKDIKNEVIAVTTNTDKVYVFQVGVFKSLDNANKYLAQYPCGGIYQDNDLYRVIVAVTKNNKEKLESYFASLNIEYYIKEVMVKENILEKILNYDEVLNQSNNNEVIDNINKSSVELFIDVVK